MVVGMITLEDCVAFCGLTEKEVLTIAEHEHMPEIAASQGGAVEQKWLMACLGTSPLMGCSASWVQRPPALATKRPNGVLPNMARMTR